MLSFYYSLGYLFALQCLNNNMYCTYYMYVCVCKQLEERKEKRKKPIVTLSPKQNVVVVVAFYIW